MAAWFEEEDFWTRFAPLMFDERHWAEVPAVVDSVLRLAGTPRPEPGARAPAVLDSCCGVGRHSIELALRGFRVTGVDITLPYLDAARESAEAFGCAPEFLRADVRAFSRPSSFDLAINLFRSFGYFDTPEEDFVTLVNIRTSLAPGGAFVLETLGKEVAVHDFIESEWYEVDGMTVLAEYRVEGAWEGLWHHWVILKEGERFDRSFVLRLYSAAEMRRSLLTAGFETVEIYGGLDGEPYDEKATSLVAVARVGS
jgi:SAM-dependent methyltransferase